MTKDVLETESKLASRAPSAGTQGTLLRWTIAGSIAGCIASVCEAVAVSAGANGQTTVLLALGLCAGLLLPLGAIVGAVLGFWWVGLNAVCGPLGRLYGQIRIDRTVDARVSAALIAVVVALGLTAGCVFVYAGGVAAKMANPRLAALSTGIFAAGMAVAAALFGGGVFAVLHRVCARIGGRRGTVRTLATVLLIFLFLLAATIWVLSGLDWRMLRFAPWLVLSILAGAVPFLGVVLRRLFARRFGWLAAGVLGLVLTASCGLAIRCGRHAGTVDAAQAHGWLAPLGLELGRRLGDRDGDGFSAIFNGGDCNDHDPRVHPGAVDIPGNGIDENCIGGDAVAPSSGASSTARGTVARGRMKPVGTKPGAKAAVQNVLIVCIDTLRADKLGILGNPNGLTPNLDRLAASGALFAQAFAQGPNTPQSFPSIFTSQYLPRVPVYKRFEGYPKLRPEAVTLFEILQQAGLRTVGVTSHFYFKEERGITQGAVEWDNEGATSIKDSNKDIVSPRVVPRAQARLRAYAKAATRFAMFVHLPEPHSTYVTHPEYKITERGVAGLQQKYDFEIKFADQWFGRLMQTLEETGLDKNTAVVLFGDHGESFGEHKFYFHGQALYNEVLHIPLIVRVPGAKANRVTERVALLDLAPTVLDLLGIDIPTHFQGVSLGSWVRGEHGPSNRKIAAALEPYPAWPKGQQALMTGKYKVIYRVQENRTEVYDLSTDPGEQRDLAARDPKLTQRLRDELARYFEQELSPVQ